MMYVIVYADGHQGNPIPFAWVDEFVRAAMEDAADHPKFFSHPVFIKPVKGD
jgi:hypothetical protein